MSSVCVHGLGYIGLPTAAMLANSGHEVNGYDADPEVRSRLRDIDVPPEEPGLSEFVEQAFASGNLKISDEPVAADYHVVCVPTPFDQVSKTADLEYVRSAGRAIAANLQSGDTVILESTVPPGTTVDEVGMILEMSGLSVGDDFALAHSPETVLPGNIIPELRENDRIVGGVDTASVESAVHLYESFVDGSIRTVTDPTIAEFVKLIQNTSRDVNIALANEIAKIAGDYGIDSREAIGLANSHPRVDILQPGPGVGGHCLPVDPWFLGEGSDELELIETARQVNDTMSTYVIDLLRSELGDLGGRKIAILGAAYKGNVGDTRMSPGLKIARELQHVAEEQQLMTTDGGSIEPPEIAIHDPHVTDPTLKLTDLQTATTDADAVIIATDHDEFQRLDLTKLGERMRGRTILDTKGVTDPTTWRQAGFTIRRI
jgi:UDP-N-acetyl-D-mannosaminuronic acid dehydrogenase